MWKSTAEGLWIKTKYLVEAYDVLQVMSWIKTICRHRSDCNSLREEQLQNLDMVYAGQGLYPQTLIDLVEFFVSCKQEHCLHSRGADFEILLTFEKK